MMTSGNSNTVKASVNCAAMHVIFRESDTMIFHSKSTISIAALIAGLGMAAWSPASHACAAEPLVASICTMAFNPGARFQSMNQSYILATDRACP
jgi:hypothetical protein